MKKVVSLVVCTFAFFVFFNSVSYATTSSSNSEELKSGEAYKLLYENAQEINGKILDTVYWALGGMVGVIILFIGGNIFFNSKVSKNEMDTMASEYRGKFTDFKNEIERELGQNFNSLKDALREDSNNNIQALNQRQIELINSFNNSLSSQLTSTKSQLESRVSDIEGVNIDQTDAINSTNKQLTKLIEQEVEKLEKRFIREHKRIQIEILENEGRLFEVKEIHKTVLRSYIEAAIIKAEIGYSLDFSFENIIETIKKCDKIEADYRKNLAELFEVAGPQYDSVKVKIDALLKER
ncbi:hypothetical protein [Bacillus thuringiensis]|uniref:hypothetical protein n=1 Tax=Bacillus thuringiensis TaxID=1428 RepID=UPI000CF8A475|nr:hypothetical protein [Bacillus thuringiensis]PQQ45500.1 hypothetical protein C6A34_19420 [Bacillus thuringiensis]